MRLQPSKHKQKLKDKGRGQRADLSVLSERQAGGRVGQDIVFEFEAIGTHWVIEIFNTKPSDIIDKIKSRIEEFDKNYSRFRADSLVTKMSQKAGSYLLPDDAQPMLDLYKKLYELSKGKVTPLIGQVLSDAGYDAQYSFKPKEITKVLMWQESLEYNFPHLNTKKPVLLDFGALGKGYLVDLVAELLRAQGINKFVINAGGDIYCHGSDDVKIALENPDNSTQAIGIATITSGAICGSASNKRAWAGHSHIMDPDFPKQPMWYKAVWAATKSTMFADALTTALQFCSVEDLRKNFEFEYAIIRQDNSLTYSANFPAEFFNEERD